MVPPIVTGAGTAHTMKLMRKRLFMLFTLLLLVGLAIGTRYGDVVLYTADWVFAAATLVVFAAWCFWWLPDHPLVLLSTDWTSLLLVVAVIALTLLSPYRYGAQVEAAKPVSYTHLRAHETRHD